MLPRRRASATLSSLSPFCACLLPDSLARVHTCTAQTVVVQYSGWLCTLTDTHVLMPCCRMPTSRLPYQLQHMRIALRQSTWLSSWQAGWCCRHFKSQFAACMAGTCWCACLGLAPCSQASPASALQWSIPNFLSSAHLRLYSPQFEVCGIPW